MRVTRLLVCLGLLLGVTVIAPAPAKAEAFSCNNWAWVPYEWGLVTPGGTEIPLLVFGEAAQCSDEAAMALTIRPERQLMDTPFNIWKAWGNPHEEACPGFCTFYAISAPYTCREGHYRTEGRVVGASYVKASADAAESVSDGMDAECNVEGVFPPCWPSCRKE